MMYPYFSSEQLLPLYPALMLLIFAVLLFEKGKFRFSLSLLFLGALSMGIFIARLDSFLILWDEQYHALVAKNMMDHPFKPMLYAQPVLAYDYRDWVNNSLWLHKQPLFLWQIALSLKLFGINTFALRIPSILMHAILPLMIYRIGSIAINRSTGFYGALFFAVAYYPLELVAARYSTDHNDVAFLFYITASLWSWFEYQRSGKPIWIIAIGVFSGCAVLVKWLVGLLVYAPWALSILSDKQKRNAPIEYIYCAAGFLITLLVFLPWQYYVFHFYPQEAHYELSMNTRHLFNSIEDHGGNFWFHFVALRKLYGEGQAVPFLLFIGLISLYFNTKEKKYKIGLFLPLISVYLFYSIVATKMTSFCIIVAPIIFLGISSLMLTLISYLNKYLKKPGLIPYITFVIALLLSFSILDLRHIQGYHTMWKPNDNCNRQAELFEMRGISALKEQLNGEKRVVFNACMRVNGQIPVIFFTGNTAYSFIPTPEQINLVKSKGYKCAIFNIGLLPDFIKNDSSIKIITIPNAQHRSLRSTRRR